MFGTSGVRGAVGEDVTADLALSIGRAVASTGAERVVVGRDPRESGKFLADTVSAGLRECGASVVDLGLVATPTVARSVAWRDADAGVMVTASHNPPTDNGIKLWTPSGQAFDAERRTEITATVEESAFDLRPWDEVGAATEWDGATERHVTALTDGVGELSVAVDSVDDLSVAVDVGNGAGQVTATALTELGCSVETLNAQPDGSFPARPSEPTAVTCESLRKHVANTDADLGIAHDGDADRMMAVDETGAFVSGDLLLALFGTQAAGRGDRVAAPLNTSLAVDDALAEEGATLTRTPVGDVHVAERATESDVVFGGESSGAWIWPDETLCPDGPLAACKLVELVAERGPLSAQVDAIETYPLRRESVEVADKDAVMEDVSARVSDEYADVEALDGVRAEVDDGWFLIRASGTQPLVRITAEARDPDRTDELAETAAEFVDQARR